MSYRNQLQSKMNDHDTSSSSFILALNFNKKNNLNFILTETNKLN